MLSTARPSCYNSFHLVNCNTMLILTIDQLWCFSFLIVRQISAVIAKVNAVLVVAFKALLAYDVEL